MRVSEAISQDRRTTSKSAVGRRSEAGSDGGRVVSKGTRAFGLGYRGGHIIHTAVLVALLFLASLIAPGANAQITNVSNDQSTPIAGAGHDYIHSLTETVSPSNGSLSVHIELPAAKSRGITLPFTLAYDSNGVHHLIPGGPGSAGTAMWAKNIGYVSQGGWAYGVPLLNFLSFANSMTTGSTNYTCSGWSNYMFTDAHGGRHALNLGTVLSGGAGSCPGVTSAQGGDPDFQGDLPNTHPDPMNSLSTASGPVTVYGADGTVYTFPAVTAAHNVITNFGGYTGSYSLPTTIEDRNGNKINVTDNGSANFSFADTANRTGMSVNGMGTTTNSITVGGMSYIVTWTSVTSSYSVSPVQIAVAGAVCTAPPAVSETETVISQITLPNGQNFKFTYGTNNADVNYQNNFGLLNEITYPNGGTVKYKWVLSSATDEFFVFPGVGSDQFHPVTDACRYQYHTPVISTRLESFDGTSTALTQNFTYSICWTSGNCGNTSATSWSTRTTTVNSTDASSGRSAQIIYSYTPYTLADQPLEPSAFPGQVPVESAVQYYDWGNTTTPLRAVNKTWYDQFNLHTEKTVLDDGSFSQKVYCYVPTATCTPGAVLSQVGKLDETDSLGNNRETVTTYQVFTTSAGMNSDKPCKIVTQDTAGANQIAETDYLYDGATAACGTTVTPTGAPAVSNLATATRDSAFASTSTKQRGNVTSATKVCLNGSGVCANSTTRHVYDETGQIYQTIDPNGNTSTFSHADSFTDNTPTNNTNTYLTSITYPVTSGITHTESFKYSWVGGELTLATDQNGIQAQYAYGDALRRLTGITYPNCTTQCGPASISYNDTAHQVITTKTLSSTQSLTNVSVSDGMGHITETQLTTDPAGTDLVDSTYDGFGRVRTHSNPHRSTASPTDGTTTDYYDALGRVCLVRPPDGGAPTLPASSNCPTSAQTNDIFTQYSGFFTTVTDQAGKARKAQTDGFGRLVNLWEDPGTTPHLNILTTYTYDRLDNLTMVVQNGSHTRTFTYDSLSRLSCASNPENSTVACPAAAAAYTAGTSGYTYDAAGNVHTKEDARGATSVITYSYDALNRLTGKTYGDSTPPVSLFYDGNQDGITSTNAKGRLVKAYTGGTNPTASYFSYDPMGRILFRSQCATAQTCGQLPPTVWTSSTAYDESGDPISYTDTTNTNAITFTQTFNGAAKPTQLTSSWNDATHPATLISSTAATAYYPTQAIHTLTLGNGLTETTAYNTRLQPCELNLNSSGVSLTGCGTPAITTGNFQDFSYNYNINTSNNGNIAGWTGVGQQNFSRSYTFDNLNRLATYSDAGTSQSCKGLSWAYDAWGNLNAQTVTAGACGTFQFTTNALNQLPAPYSYDAAGDMQSDGNHAYTYDAEGRIGTVDGTNTFYVYNAQGNRVAKGAGSSLTYFYIYGTDGQVRSERDGNGNWIQSYISFGGAEVGLYRGTHTGFDFRDHLGSTRLVTLNNQCIFDSMDFLPFGEEIAGGQATSHMFTGKERDAESGLDNFGARYFGSAMGRFMSPDPLGGTLSDPQTLNRYTYVRNNPLSLTDPTGLYLVNCTSGSAKDRKACNKAADRFEKQRKKDLKSKHPQVRDAANAWGDRGKDNHINVTFKTQQAVDADEHTAAGYHTTAFVQPGRTSDHKPVINAEFSEDARGSDLAQVIAHEGSHLEDTMNFLNSYSTTTGQYFSALNYTHFDTEFKAFETGSMVKPYNEFPAGPKGYQQLTNYIYRAYHDTYDQLEFSPVTFPQANPPQ